MPMSNHIDLEEDSPQRASLMHAATARAMSALALAHLTAAMIVTATAAPADSLADPPGAGDD